MKTSEASKRTGLKQSTIRVYEEHGLIHPDTQEQNGRLFRDYSEEDLEQLRQISSLRKALFSIEQIKLMKEDPELIPALLESHKKRVDELAEELSDLRDALDAIETPPRNIAELVQELDNTPAREFPLPKADYHPRFRYLDELYPPTGKEDSRMLRLPPKVQFFTPSYFALLPLILGAAVLICLLFIHGGLGPKTVNFELRGNLQRFVLKETDAPEGERYWEYHEIGDKYTNSANWQLASLTRRQTENGVTWRLVERRYPYDEEHTHRTLRIDGDDGTYKYIYDGKEQIPAMESSQRIDRFISETLEYDQPLSGRQITIGILSGLLVVVLAHVIWFGAKVRISLFLYQNRFTKAANAGYEAANFIEDPEHLYGPGEEKND